ncbi:MAG: hypothetical protein JXJ04_26795 [Spirochaetales bacterium]|nr:hypothetical protein [Spirochaetales bacterium]
MSKSKPVFKVLCIIVMVTLCFSLYSQQLAFPGAEGFGRFAAGGRGGNVYHVTNLNDSGSGSFRDGVSQSNRIVVFDVGGIIRIDERIVIHNNVTVAGQTAPGGGITIYGNGIALNDDSGNSIIRYIRIRMGKNGDDGKDAVGISANTDYMFDHVSVTWGRDGTFDINGTGIDNVTIQNCIIGQGINNTNHSTGGLMQSGKISVLRTLWIDNKTRNPKGRGPQEYINNVIYNWAENGYILGDTEGVSEANIMGNYFINGPSTVGNCFNSATPSFYVYASQNYWDKNRNGSLDGSPVTNAEYGPVTFVSSPFPYFGVSKFMTPGEAYHNVVNDVGASLVRDDVDKVLINQLTSLGTLGSIINTEDDNGIPGNVGTVPGGPAPPDSDQDGMPDEWEQNNGMNPHGADNNGDIDSDGYTNIEEYLNELAGDQPPQSQSTPQPTSVPTATPKTTLTGDVNSSGTIDIVDALLMAQYYVGLNPADFDLTAADVNCDSSIDIVDALLVAQYYVGLITAFPGCNRTPVPLAYDLVVAKDGSGNYTSVQSAVNAIADNRTSWFIIFIKSGIYHEVIDIPATKTYLRLVGENASTTILTYNNYNSLVGSTSGTVSTFIRPNNFIADNLTFENSFDYLNSSASGKQAVALEPLGDRQIYINCRITGYQDTLYNRGTQYRQYFKNCYIAGRTNFIFGDATAVFTHCEIYHRTVTGSTMTAPNTSSSSQYGLVFIDCQLTANSGTGTSSVNLGRPWDQTGSCHYLCCTMGAHIAAWCNMSENIWQNARFGEYKSTGAGGEINLYRPQLTDTEAALFTVTDILRGSDNWNPESVIANFNEALYFSAAGKRGIETHSRNNSGCQITIPYIIGRKLSDNLV